MHLPSSSRSRRRGLSSGALAFTLALASSALLLACIGTDFDAGRDSHTAGAAAAAGSDSGTNRTSEDPRSDSGAATADSGAVPVDPPSAQRTCVMKCEAEAGGSTRAFYDSLQACACSADAGSCSNVCPSYCSTKAADSNACNDCVAKVYVSPCSAEINCQGDITCVEFADCVYACVSNPM